MTVAINFYAHFVSSAVGATGLTVTVDLDSVAKSDGARSALVTGGAAVEGIDGYYHYRYATADLDTYDYMCIFKTTGTADQKQIPSMWANYAIGNSAAIALAAPASTALTNATWTDAKAGYLDVAISSRNATAPLDAAGTRTALGMATANLDTQLSGIPALVWSYATRTLSSVAAIAQGVWEYATRTLTQTGAQVAAAPGQNIKSMALTPYQCFQGDRARRLPRYRRDQVERGMASMPYPVSAALED